MDCEHGTYQCGAPLPGQNASGQQVILVPMWCTTCGLLRLRIPQIDAGDERRAALVAGAPPQSVPVRRG